MQAAPVGGDGAPPSAAVVTVASVIEATADGAGPVLAAPAPPPAAPEGEGAAGARLPPKQAQEERPRIYGKNSTQKRWTVDEPQRRQLEEAYNRCRFPSEAQRAEIGVQISGTGRQVQVWFQNRRQRDANQQAL